MEYVLHGHEFKMNTCMTGPLLTTCYLYLFT